MRQRMPLVGQLLELVEYQLGGAVAVGVNLLEHNVFLLLNLRLGEDGVEQYVGIELEAALKVLGQRGGVEAGLLLGGEGVQFAANAVDAARYVVRAAVGGAFEK